MRPEITCAFIGSITWNKGTDDTFTVGDAIDAWQISISQNLPLIGNYTGLLSADEIERAGRYLQQKDRERFITSRGALRVLLGQYLNKPASEITFHIGSNKKPSIKSSSGVDIHFNTSHSGDYILIAIARTSVGADVEKIDPLFPYADILEHSFSLHDIAQIQHSDRPAETFYLLWTRKEALLKATAKGIDDDIKQVPCIDGIHVADTTVIGADGKWFVNSFSITDGYIGSIAARSNRINFKQFFF